MPRPITVVSGLPRSGTSLLLQMLAAGGLPILADDARLPDADNPRGYFELARTKRLKTDASWIGEAEGKAVKVVSALLRHLPEPYAYDVLFMQRPLAAVLASQATMLARHGDPPSHTAQTAMQAAFTHHLDELERWLAGRASLRVLRIEFDQVLASPQLEAQRITAFLGRPLDTAQMAAAVEPLLRHHGG